MGGNFSRLNEYNDGDTLTEADWEGELDNIIANCTPTGLDDASSTTTTMRTTADPYPASVASLATSTAEELHRLRWQFVAVVKALNGNVGTYWYEDIPTSPVLKTPQIQDTSSDHQYIFAVSELAADRTVTLPLLTGADEFIFKDHAVSMTNKTFSDAIIGSGGIQTDGANTLKTKIIDIGDWNMDTSGFVSVAHGLTFTNIRAISVIIRNDANTDYYDFPMYDQTGTNVGSAKAVAASITLSKSSAGFFDSVDFNSTSYNRGWITITYIA